MSKQNLNLEKNIMAKVKSGKITMKPRWYFVLGSLLMSLGLAGVSIGIIFLTKLGFFLLRQHGPMGEWRLQLMLSSFPWWLPVLALIGLLIGIYLLKQYDFSYKKNFSLVVIGFFASLVLAAFIIDFFGLGDTWFRHGPMRKFYQGSEFKNSPARMGGWRSNKDIF